jgi:uncharacterized membrane protein (UPF0182 family)
MISVREVDPNLLAPSARTWQNVHLAYTHGYGMVAVQVNTSVSGGQPDFIVSEFETEKAKIPVTQPRIYFGEPPANAPEFVVANSAQPEFDAPSSTGEGTNLSSYGGSGGVQMSDAFRRLAFALRFRDVNLLISGNIKGDSRLMFNRDVRDRVELAAPWWWTAGSSSCATATPPPTTTRTRSASTLPTRPAATSSAAAACRASATTSATPSRPWSTPTPAR